MDQSVQPAPHAGSRGCLEIGVQVRAERLRRVHTSRTSLDIETQRARPRGTRHTLQAHLDLQVVDSQDAAQFALEFHGAAHDFDPDTIARDQMRDAICDRPGMPMIRVDQGGS